MWADTGSLAWPKIECRGGLKVEVVPLVSFAIPARSLACPLWVLVCSFISFSGRRVRQTFTARAVTEINAFWLSDNKLRIQAACPEAPKGARPVPPLIPLSVLLYSVTPAASAGPENLELWPSREGFVRLVKDRVRQLWSNFP